MSIIVTDAAGLSATVSLSFSVAEADLSGTIYTLYSQKDGWWQNTAFGANTMEKAGGILFSLSGALWELGETSLAILPENLAESYGEFCTADGVDTDALLKKVAEDFGLKAPGDVLHDAQQAKTLLQNGAVLLLAVAPDHAALVSGLTPDGSMVQVRDSNPAVLFGKVPEVSPSVRAEEGEMIAVSGLLEAPDNRWYLDTQDFGGLEYWLSLEDAAALGLYALQK